MSDAAIFAILGAIVPSLAALAAFVVAVVNALKTNKIAAQAVVNADASKDRNAVLVEKASEIHAVANSNFAKLESKLALVEQRNAELLRQVGELQVRAALATPVPLAAPVAAPVAPIPVVVENTESDPAIVSEPHKRKGLTPPTS